jgi:hypothetical protein
VEEISNLFSGNSHGLSEEMFFAKHHKEIYINYGWLWFFPPPALCTSLTENVFEVRSTALRER